MSDLSTSHATASAFGLALEVTPHYYKSGRRGLAGEQPGVCLQLLVGEDRFNIEARLGKADALREAFGNTFGAAPLDMPKTVGADGFEFLGIGPGRWHAISREPGRQERRSRLCAEIRDLATMVDVSHGFTVFRLTGPMAAAALSKLVRIDLDPAIFSAGSCVTTVLHGMTVQLRRTRDGDAYECAVARSFGGSLFHALAHAADAHGLLVQPAAEIR